MDLYFNSAIKESTKEYSVDLVMFMGQSNMAGRGVASRAPIVPIVGVSASKGGSL